MTVDKLKEVMKFHLRNFNTSNTDVNDQTKHGDILNDDDGAGTANSKRIYKSFIRWTIIQADHEDKSWPQNWINMTVEELAQKLL